ncbi:MAG: bifunctional (p)ppGpp synthetase/guanosine-3',5'-bis(diphosphate) 3'-pyrophosphohydrolase [Deltaproteobacteria bacterium]|nr:bifunctional (p)ppGpp synthetase/guanosine-3',5'-bis(diphosphate) 3'-pyrophosphohydrolase [Deltaproteobacteria bacterium]MCB9479525.1 bifunctional (p)ppGpp synthetase/guanosine-3',5'-bis(diphosphate) 3'-pyrophosphohydrolase [Deltaproteobacteria bacterium]MCB9488445.1 bifunctional (p)ppGpp synthetase/guanosine-3',5'-bis(diphosphate) 3'-pyrophosphohydrolase [Deltaproteobacteria bacterium]
MIRIDDILSEVRSHAPKANLDLLRKAYVYSAKAHQGQIRKSGEPYLTHPLEVAHILAKMQMDDITVTTGLLHDTVEDCPNVSLDELAKLFGDELAGLVDGVTKIGQMEFTSREHQQAENFKKILIATTKDVRVILVKLADRLHNMRTLEHMKPATRRRIALETLDIYAPLANRLGIQWVKNELEDLAFRYLDPKAYYSLVLKVTAHRQQRERFIADVIQILENLLYEHAIEGKVKGRAKNIYSIHNKMMMQGVDFEQVFDVIAFRIIVGTEAECYETLGYIHSRWKPVPGRFKDYIALPKENGYQSLHTTVIGPDGKRMEIQIRTEEMDHIAEEGLAAHWQYKENRNQKVDVDIVKWLRKMVEAHQTESPDEYLSLVKQDLFPEEVFVFTPKGDVMTFPRGATPIDFAYRIHTEVGHQCVGAKVNGQIVPLGYHLVSGDHVEVLTRKDHVPNRDWLKMVATSSARSKIRHFLSKQETERSISTGRAIAERELRKHRESLSRLEKSGRIQEVAEKYGLSNVDKLMAALAVGKISVPGFVQNFVADETESKTRFQDAAVERLLRPLARRKDASIKIGGIDNVVFSLAKCCNPIPGDKVKGFVTRGRGITIHVAGCVELQGADPERIIDVDWDTESDLGLVTARVDVFAVDAKSLMSRVSGVFGKNDVNITEVQSITHDDNSVVMHFKVQVATLAQLDRTVNEVRLVSGVTKAMRVGG